MPFSYEINPDDANRVRRRSSRTNDTEVQHKALGANIGSLTRGTAVYDPNAFDGDGDGLVQDSTPFERPAVFSNIANTIAGGLASAGGATGIFSNGRSNLVGLSNREVAERVVPSTPTEFLNQRLQHSRGDLQIDELHNSVSFDPDDVDELRQIVEKMLDDRPALRASWDRFGSPPIAMVTGDNLFSGIFMTDSILINSKSTNKKLSTLISGIGGSKFTNSINALPIKGLKRWVTSESAEDIVAHEWGHYLHRLTIDYHPNYETRQIASLLYSDRWSNLTPRWNSEETLRLGGLRDFYAYFAEVFDAFLQSDKKKFDPPSDDMPFVNTGYGTTEPAEFVAESFAAYFSPSKKTRALLNPAGVELIESVFLGIGRSGLASSSGNRQATTSNSMKGLTPEEMAKVIVPSNIAEALLSLQDHQALLSLDDDKSVNANALKQVLTGGVDALDFSPEIVEEMRQVITGAIANNRLFRDVVERHGFPPVLISKRGAKWDDGDDTFAVSMIDGFPAIVVNQDVRQKFLGGEFSNLIDPSFGSLRNTDQFLISTREDSMFAHEWGHYINVLAIMNHPDPEVRRLATFWFSSTWDHDAGLTGVFNTLAKLGVDVGKDKFSSRMIGSKKFGKRVADGKQQRWNGYPHAMSQYGQTMPAEAFAEGVTAILIDDINLRDKVSPALRDDIFEIIGKPYTYERDIAGGIDESRAGLASVSIPRNSAGDRTTPTINVDSTPIGGRNYLENATNEEIADILAVRSADDAFNLFLMNILYGKNTSFLSAADQASLKSVFMQHFLGYGSPSGSYFPDFSPKGVDRVRQIIKSAVDASPIFAWQIRTFGSVGIIATDPSGIDSARKLEKLSGAKLLDDILRSQHIGGWSLSTAGIFLNFDSVSFRTPSPIGQRPEATRYETPDGEITRIPSGGKIAGPGIEFLGNIDMSPEGILFHEWAHSFYSRVIGAPIKLSTGAKPGTRTERLSYLFPGNPNADDIGKFIKTSFDADLFIPTSSIKEIQGIVQRATRTVLATLGQQDADNFVALMTAYASTLVNKRNGQNRWRPSFSDELLEEVNLLYPFLTSDLLPLMRNTYGNATRQEQFAELNVLWATPDQAQRAKFLTPELEHAMAYVFGLKPTPDVAPYVRPWETRQGLASSSAKKQRAIASIDKRVSTHKEPFPKAQRAHSRKDSVYVRDGLTTATIGDYTFSMRESLPTMDKVYEAWTDNVENWRMRFISSEIMGIRNVGREDSENSFGSDANQYLLSGSVNNADSQSKEQIQRSTMFAISAMNNIAEGGYSSDTPLYRSIRNVDTGSGFFEPEIGSVISMPLTSFSPNYEDILKYANNDDSVQISDAISTAVSSTKKNVIVKLREGVASVNATINKPSTDRDGRIVDMPIEALTAGEFVVKSVKSENGIEIIELEQSRVIHPILGSSFDGSDALVSKNKRNAILTANMSESLNTMKQARENFAQAATYGAKNQASDDIAFETHRYSSIMRQLRSDNDAVDKIDTPLRVGGFASLSRIEDRAKRHEVSLDVFNDESLDDDDIAESVNEWSLSKTGKIMAGDVVVVRTRNDGKKEILTVERKRGPFRGALALPGGLQNENEDLYDTAEREMFEEVNISPTDSMNRQILGQIDTRDWDTRFVEGGRVAGIRFDINEEQSSRAMAGGDASRFSWIDVGELSRGQYPIAFGHASWLAESFADDPVLGPRFAVLAEASRVRNQRLIKKIDAKRKEAGVKEFGEMPDPSQPYKTTNEGVRTGLVSASSFDRNIDVPLEVSVDFLKLVRESRDYLLANPMRDDVYNQVIDLPWIDGLLERVKRSKMTHAELVGVYKAFTQIVDEHLNKDVDAGTAFARRTALQSLRNSIKSNDEHFVRRYTVGGRYTWGAYRGRDYLGDYRTEELANQAIRNSVDERSMPGLASASAPMRRSDSDIPEAAKTKFRADIASKQEEIDALEELNNRLRSAGNEFDETGNWEGQKWNIRLDEGNDTPTTYTREELEADLEEGQTFDDFKKQLLNKIDSAGFDRGRQIEVAKKEQDSLKQKLNFLETREQNDNSFSIDELLADEELADELRKRHARVQSMTPNERDATYRDNEGYTYVLHWGASNLIGGELDPARSRGQSGGVAAGNTRRVNEETARYVVGKRNEARMDLSILEEMKLQIERDGVVDFEAIGRSDPANPWRGGRARLLFGISRRDGDVPTATPDAYKISMIDSQINSENRTLSRLDKIADQLIADDYQYTSTYRASGFQALFGAYGGRYAEEDSKEWGDNTTKSPSTGIHLFRVKIGEDAMEENSVGETHLVGKHTPVASLIADNDDRAINPASNTWAGWVDMAIEQDKERRRSGLASAKKDRAEAFDEKSVEKLRKRQSELKQMSDEELSKIFSDEEYTYVVHAGSEEIEGDIFDPSKSVGNLGLSEEGNTRRINKRMSDRYMRKYEKDRSTAISLEYIIETLKNGDMIENPTSLRDPEVGEQGAVQGLDGVLFDIGTVGGPYLGVFSRSIRNNEPFPSQKDLDKRGITREELIEYLENVGLPLINEQIKSRQQVAEQLRKDDGQLISAYEISDVIQGVSLDGYGGRYGAEYDPSKPKARGESFDISSRYDRQGIHIARVRIGIDADRMSPMPNSGQAKGGDPQDLEIHMVGQHEVVASISTPTWAKFTGSQDEKFKVGQDFFMAWMEETVNRDKKSRSGLASSSDRGMGRIDWDSLNGDGLDGYIPDIREELEGYLSPESVDAIEKWTMDSIWPRKYLNEVNDEEYTDHYEVLQSRLFQAGFPEMVTISRRGTPNTRGNIRNGSAFEGWRGGSDDNKNNYGLDNTVFVSQVPRENIIGVGSLEEGEFFYRNDGVVTVQESANRLGGLASMRLTPQQSRVVGNVQNQVSDIVQRNGLASRTDRINPISVDTESIVKELELTDSERSILESTLPSDIIGTLSEMGINFQEVDLLPALSNDRERLLNSIRVAVGEDNIPYAYAEPHPLLVKEGDSDTDWSSVSRPSGEQLEQIREIYKKLTEKIRKSGLSEYYEKRVNQQNDENRLGFIRDSDSFSEWSLDLLNKIAEANSPSDDYKPADATRNNTYIFMWLNALQNLNAVSRFSGVDSFLDAHDVWGHVGTGRGFDRHGEWANMLFMFSLTDRWGQENNISKERLNRVKINWYNNLEATRIIGEFTPTRKELMEQDLDNWHILESIPSGIIYEDDDFVAELVSLIEKRNISKPNSDVSYSDSTDAQRGFIATNDIVRQGLASSAESLGNNAITLSEDGRMPDMPSRTVRGKSFEWVDIATKSFALDAPTFDIKSLNYTKPALRESIKRRIMAGSKGGASGQWSARKAQMVAIAYRKAGGGYRGGVRKTQRSLKKWTRQKWRTSDGKPAIRKGGTRRYLPASAWSKLTQAQRAATNRKKIIGSRRGNQFVSNTRSAANVSRRSRKD